MRNEKTNLIAQFRFGLGRSLDVIAALGAHDIEPLFVGEKPGRKEL